MISWNLKHDLLSGMLKTVKEKQLKSNVKDQVAAYTELWSGATAGLTAACCGFNN